MEISPQFRVKQLVKRIGKGGRGPFSTQFQDFSPPTAPPHQPLLASVVWDQDKLGFRVLQITGRSQVQREHPTLLRLVFLQADFVDRFKSSGGARL